MKQAIDQPAQDVAKDTILFEKRRDM